MKRPSFRATLEEALSADVLVYVGDASHPDWEEQAAVLVRAAKGTGLNALGAALSNGANRGPT